jgi:hypothetical protein
MAKNSRLVKLFEKEILYRKSAITSEPYSALEKLDEAT